MSLPESAEMYLETILILSEKQPHVRAIDVVEYMGFLQLAELLDLRCKYA